MERAGWGFFDHAVQLFFFLGFFSLSLLLCTALLCRRRAYVDAKRKEEEEKEEEGRGRKAGIK